jgi:hypothetical protein
MDAERRQRLKELFFDVLELPPELTARRGARTSR